MRTSKDNVIVALFGPTCSGKTTVARKLGERLRCEVRHCGEVLKDFARSTRRTVPELTRGEHSMLDAETRKIAIASVAAGERRVIEGTFLDCVLEGVSGVLTVRLFCDDNVRATRFGLRAGLIGDSLEALRQRDADDARLRIANYQPVASPVVLELDSGIMNPDDCVAAVLKHLITNDAS